jgi:hypothetical protein
MIDALSHLHLGHPQMGCVRLLAVVALQILYGKFHNETLLQQGVVEDFLLHCHFNFNSPGVRLCPHESSIDQLDAL